MIRSIRRPYCLSQDDDGATAIEYALLASLIAALIVTIVFSIGTKVQGLFASVVF